MLKKTKITFPVVFEVLIWLLYVGMYKYSYMLDAAHLPHQPDSNFPYLQVCLYAICSTLYLIPYYRWAVPRLLHKKWYWILFATTILVFVVISQFNDLAFLWVFAQANKGLTVHRFFANQLAFHYLDFNLLLTDLLAFFCIAFSRFSYQNEVQRHQVETDHLQLQLSMLKAQLQPHFLFNTLNGLYGMSLTGSKDTPRFILLLSQMMQYILYDCDKETVSLSDELNFLKGYFELEQKKFPNSKIVFNAPDIAADISIPPLLFLPLVENSFKHGKHKLEDTAGVQAELTVTSENILFRISNDTFNQPSPVSQLKHGGIGLINIKKRLELYYPNRHEILLQPGNDNYIAQVILNYK